MLTDALSFVPRTSKVRGYIGVGSNSKADFNDDGFGNAITNGECFIIYLLAHETRDTRRQTIQNEVPSTGVDGD